MSVCIRMSSLVRRRREMKFGKSLRNEIAETLPEWRGEFISYKELKKQLKKLIIAERETRRCGKSSPRQSSAENRLLGAAEVIRNVQGSNCPGDRVGFIQLLDSELEKVNAFFIGKEEEYVIRIKELKERVANLDSSEDTTDVKLDILEFHGEMVLLLHYSVINFAGLLKIVKKHNKKTGAVICLSFMPEVLQQPFFTTDLICKLLEECEAMLNQLFHVNNP